MATLQINLLFVTFFQSLYNTITRKYSNAMITRISLTLLDVWQAYATFFHNDWIPDLIGGTSAYYTVYSLILATLAIISLCNKSLRLAAAVLTANIVQYMYLTFAALWFVNPPKASAGMTAFITLTCISGLWRIVLGYLHQKDTSCKD